MKLLPDYAFFYLEGRNDKHIRADIDTDQLAKDVIAGKGTIHELVHAAVTAAAEGHRVDRKKRMWIDDYETDINAAGGDGEEAYRHYLAGRIDELTHHLEGEVVEEMLEISGGGDDDEESDDEDEEDDAAE